MSEESDRSRIPYSASGETEHYIKKLAAHLLTNRVILVQLQTLHDHLYMFDRLWKPKSRTAPQMGCQPLTLHASGLRSNSLAYAARSAHANYVSASDFSRSLTGGGEAKSLLERSGYHRVQLPCPTSSSHKGVCAAPQMSSQRLLR